MPNRPTARLLTLFVFLSIVVATTFVADRSTAIATGEIDDGLVGYWTFDDGQALDHSGNGNFGVVNGPNLVQGKIGEGALNFDGENNHVDLGPIHDYPSDEITVAAWINPRDLANCSAYDCRILSKATGIWTQDHYIMLSTIRSAGDVRLRFRLMTDGWTELQIASSGNLSNGEWVHVAATYDGSNMRLFVDGEEIGSVPKTGPIDNDPSVPVWIGGNPSSLLSRPWSGTIDDVRMYDRALTQQEIQLLINPPAVPFECNGLAATLIGSIGDDVLVGTNSDDVIVSLGGNDTISGLGGNDTICAGEGDDFVDGGDGDDFISGGNGRDKLNGDGGTDEIDGGSGNDNIRGGSDSDLLFGGSGDDTIRGNEGDDELFGDGGDDNLDGNDGDDVIMGGSGSDSITGGRNDDILSGGADSDELIGGSGNDSLAGGDGDDSLIGGRDFDVCDGGGGSNSFLGCEGSSS